MRQVCLLIVFTLPLAAQSLYNDTTIHELRIDFAYPAWKDSLAAHVPSETDIPARLTVAGIVYDSIGVRYKGNSSYNVASDKKPFNLSIDAYHENQLLYGYKTLNLNNFFKDPTCVREKIAYEIAAAYFPAVQSAYVKLFINGEYWGLYLNVQQINKIFLREHFSAQGGNLYKGDPPGSSMVFGSADFTWHGTDTAYYRGRYELKTNEEQNDWTDLVLFIDRLNNLPDGLLASEIGSVLNVDRALWYLAYCNLFVNLDSYLGSGHNFYLYDNPLDGMNMILWDINEVLGTFSSDPLTIPQRETLPLLFKAQDAARPLVRRLLGVPAFRQRYYAHCRTMMEEVFSEGWWLPRIQKYQNLITAPLSADTRKLYNMTQFSANVTANIVSSGPGPAGTVPGILSFINNRRAYLLTLPELTGIAPVINSLVHVLPAVATADSVVFSASVRQAVAVRLWWSVDDGRFQSRAMDRSQGDTSHWTCTTPLPAPGSTVRYYVETSASSGLVMLYPRRAEHVTLSFTVPGTGTGFPVVINEVMASNALTIRDPQGEYDDWIELYNTSTDTVTIGGLYMSDEPHPQSKWRIPAAARIPPKGFVLIWADEDIADVGGFHADFKISKSGEAVYLWDSSGAVILDSTSFGAQADDRSWSRVPDGTGSFRVGDPTPGVSNGVLGVTMAGGLPGSVMLFQNYPNPFNPVTVIRYTVGGGGEQISGAYRVMLRVYDLLGREVAGLVDRAQVPGGYAVIFDGSQLPSGVYFYRLQVGAQSRSGKMVLAR